MQGRTIGILGAVLTATGALGPFYYAPVFGSSSIVEQSPLAGFTLLACALAGGYYSVKRSYGWVSVAGYTASIISVLSIVAYLGALDRLQAKFDQFWLGWLGHFLIGNVSLSWGAIMLLGGSILMARAASLLRAEPKYAFGEFSDPASPLVGAHSMGELLRAPAASGEVEQHPVAERDETTTDQKIRDKWTSKENATLVILFFGAIAAFFVLHWLAAVALFVWAVIHTGRTNARHRQSLENNTPPVAASGDGWFALPPPKSQK